MIGDQLERSEEFRRALTEFVGAFEVVFHYDWQYTTCMIGGEDPTFLRPGLSAEEESEDWGARGALLEKYRNLIAAMKNAGLRPVYPFPLDRLDSKEEPLW